jgi:hypothetical protein
MDTASANKNPINNLSKYKYPCCVVTSAAKKYQYMIESEFELNEEELDIIIDEKTLNEAFNENAIIVFVSSPVHPQSALCNEWLGLEESQRAVEKAA